MSQQKLSYYKNGKVYCTACEKWLTQKEQEQQVERLIPSGRHLHSKQYCNSKTKYPGYIRYLSQVRKARKQRQANAVYY